MHGDLIQEYDWEAGYWASVWPSCEAGCVEERARLMRWGGYAN